MASEASAGARPAWLDRWHAIFASEHLEGLDELLADDVVFLSPVVHTPQTGRAVTAKYLRAARAVLYNDSFRYVGEWLNGSSAVLEFDVTLDGIIVNGVDMIHADETGRIARFKVMVRPLKAINLLHQRMGAQLQQQA